MPFFIPHHLLSSGIGGVAIMFYFAVGLPVGVGIFRPQHTDYDCLLQIHGTAVYHP